MTTISILKFKWVAKFYVIYKDAIRFEKTKSVDIKYAYNGQQLALVDYYCSLGGAQFNYEVIVTYFFQLNLSFKPNLFLPMSCVSAISRQIKFSLHTLVFDCCRSLGNQINYKVIKNIKNPVIKSIKNLIKEADLNTCQFSVSWVLLTIQNSLESTSLI